MKSKFTANLYLKCAGFILVGVLVTGIYGYRSSQPVRHKNPTPEVAAGPVKVKPSAKVMAPGAACCKVSFSRAGLLSQEVNPQKKNK